MKNLDMIYATEVNGGTLGPGGGSDPGNRNRTDNGGLRYISDSTRTTLKNVSSLAGGVTTLVGRGAVRAAGLAISTMANWRT